MYPMMMMMMMMMKRMMTMMMMMMMIKKAVEDFPKKIHQEFLTEFDFQIQSKDSYIVW